MERGSVIRIDDRETGFDDRKAGRPYAVVGSIGDPPHTYLVVPRTRRGSQGVKTPAGVLPGLQDEGRFLHRAYPIPATLAEAADDEGILPQRWRDQVLEN